ncbi:uncharacterized protein TNCV_599321 [Trichonephila clavipes]|nr:uncharacterized protein TNCV_599321 [Trichonephila clavipes]
MLGSLMRQHVEVVLRSHVGQSFRVVLQHNAVPHTIKETTRWRGYYANDECKRGVYKEWWQRSKIVPTSTLKAFQCNNRIAMAQRKHLDDFYDRIIGRLECERTQLEVFEELESPRVSSPGFGNDSR